MGVCCIQKDNVILANSIIKNKKNSQKESSSYDSSNIELCHIEKNLEKVESSGPILNLLMQKLGKKDYDTKNYDKENDSTKITKILNENSIKTCKQSEK